MPGIVAVIDSKNDESLTRSMASSITHEKWQQTDLYFEPPLAIGRVHLGIVNSESQPIFNEDESICIVMNGEVFDYEEEKKKLELNGHKFKVNNDPEFCLHLFEEYGERFVEKLNGSFVLVIYDIRNKRILIANDRHGLRPFYYAKNGDRYLFSSEVKAILRDRTFKKEVNHEAVADFFAFDRILGEKTLFKGIRIMSPASIAVWSEGKLSFQKYWNFEFKEDYSSMRTEDYYAKKLVHIFRKAVRRRTEESHRLGIFLSGGLDSRSIVAALDKMNYPIHTFTYGVKGGDEAKIAKAVAKKLGIPHTFLELEHDYLANFAEKGVYLTDGLCNCQHFHWISVLQRVRENVDIIFQGLGLGMMLGGSYLGTFRFGPSITLGGTYLGTVDQKKLKGKDETVLRLIYRKFNTLVPEEIMSRFYSRRYYRKVRGLPFLSLSREFKKVGSKEPANKSDCLFLRNYPRYHLTSLHLRNYLEERVPAFDNEFVDLVLQISPQLRFGHKIFFKFFSKLSPDLAKIPYQKTGMPPKAPSIAHKIGLLVKGSYKLLIRKIRSLTRGKISVSDKMGYPDYNEWIRRNRKLRRFFEDILLSEKTLSRGYFNRKCVTQLVKDHMSGRKDSYGLLCALLTFELWHRLFID